MKFYNSAQSGFSLVETLVAITILLIIIVGPMTISSSTARSTSFASEQVIAFFLAQEGAEIVQKVRDDHMLKSFLDPSDANHISDPWDTFKADPKLTECFDSTGCNLEFDSANEGELKAGEECGPNDCIMSYDDGASGRALYTIDDIDDPKHTQYTRVIKLRPGATPDSVRVTSEVFWRTGDQAATQNVLVESYLYNVYGR